MKKIISLFIVSVIIFTCCVISAGNAFALESKSFTYKELSDGTAEITGYTGNGGNIEIPAELDGLEVTSIGTRAFYQNKNIENVILPDTVAYIGDRAFAGAHITGITMTDSVVELGAGAFTQCVFLTDVTLSAGLSVISNNCFSTCTRLESIVIPEGVSIIDVSAFQFCNHLTSISLPSTLITIDQYGLAQTAIEEITLPEGLTDINYCAFFQCEMLESVTIPAGVKTLGDYSFGDCLSLNEVNLEDGVETIGTGAFDKCPFKDITIPASVKNIADYSIGFIDELVEYTKNTDLVISCYKDSAAYNYALKFNFESKLLDAPTEPSEPTIPTQPSEPTQPTDPVVSLGLLGDADKNGKVNVKDATTIQKVVADMEVASYNATVADVDANGKVNVRDATAIQKWVADIETGLDIGKEFFG